MFKYVLTSLQGYKLRNLKNDIISGIIVAALTIPVAMGYAQVAGLPPIYGLYASIFPVLGYILFASSPQLIFGIDASASAITGSLFAAFGIAAASADAQAAAPVLSLFTGIFLVVFAVFKLGRFSEYISMPVMSGFISGVALSIIVGQVPKVLGLDSDGTNFFGNMSILIQQITKLNWISLAMGVASIAIILLGKKFLRKIPMALIVLVLGTVLSAVFTLDQQGVVIVGTIPSGFPPLSLPQVFSIGNLPRYIGGGFIIAVVIFADSLLSSNSFAIRNGYTLNTRREIFAFGTSNLMAAFSGCSPTSASVSRTAASEQFKGKTQMTSIVAAVLITFVTVFLSGLLYYMPQPVLSGIIIAALVGVVDFAALRDLLRHSRREAAVWIASAAGVLLVGVLFGVLIGVLLSFINVIARLSSPPQAFLGTIKGREGYYDLASHKRAKAVPGVTIYRFSARLFFGNINVFVDSIKKTIADEKPRMLIIEASGINEIDVTAVDGLREITTLLEKEKVDFYFTGLIQQVEKQIEKLGLGPQIGKRHIKKTIAEALALLPPEAEKPAEKKNNTKSPAAVKAPANKNGTTTKATAAKPAGKAKSVEKKPPAPAKPKPKEPKK